MLLLNSTNLLSSLGHLGVHGLASIQTFDFSALCTSVPRGLLGSRVGGIINNAFGRRNGAARCARVGVGGGGGYFAGDPLSGDSRCTAGDICKVVEFLVDDMCVGLVDGFSGGWLAFLWERAVPHC